MEAVIYLILSAGTRNLPDLMLLGFVLLAQTAVGPPGTYTPIGSQSGIKISKKQQMLDVTDQGVWVDAEWKEHTLSAVIFFEPSGQAEGTVAS